MQIGGLGGSHSASDHHVTNCIHDHHDVQKGSMEMKSSAPAEVSATQSELLQEGQFSLEAWLKNMLGNGRGLLLNFWRDGQTADGVEENRTATGSAEGSRAAIQTAAHTENFSTAAAAAVQPNTVNNASYSFGAERKKNQKRAFWQKARDHFRNMPGRSDGKRSQRFSGFQAGKSSCQTKQERPAEEELRRHNRYRRDTVEINVARTEENYLMDSYDRRGEYSRLTTKK